METIVVNAVGEQCPVPVVKASKALEQMTGPGVLEVHVDNEIAVQNVSRLASGKGLQAASERLEEKHFVIRIAVETPLTAPAVQETATACGADARGDFVVAVSSDGMGAGDDELGRTLMKGFIFALTQLEELPKTILFYNGGAAITTEGSVSLEDLRSLEAQGVEIMTCGTCLNYYGLTDKLAVGAVSNMYTIVETLAKAGKVIRP